MNKHFIIDIELLSNSPGLLHFVKDNLNICMIYKKKGIDLDDSGLKDHIKTVEEIKSSFDYSVLIGNDDELISFMNESVISIGYQLNDPFSSELINRIDYLTFNEKRLIDLLHRMFHNKQSEDVSIVISCAGMGTRLGLNCTKALIEIAGQSLIERQLDILQSYSDIRIVVGYQAEKVINKVNPIRDDILYVFNHDYKNTGTGASFTLGVRYGGTYACALDGDLLVYPDDLIKVINFDGSCVGGTIPSSDEPWTMPVKEINGIEMVTGFSKSEGYYEWTGLAKVQTELLKPGTHHVFHLVEPLLPLPLVLIRTKEIDTMDDYARAVKWIENGYKD